MVCEPAAMFVCQRNWGAPAKFGARLLAELWRELRVSLVIEGHDFEEIEFLTHLARRTGCSLLLDINNAFVSARNIGTSAERYVDAFPADHVVEVHLAGHRPDPTHGQRLLIDSHDAAVPPEVWSLFERFVARAGRRPTLIERDAELPAFDVLMAERDQADRRLLLREAKAA